MGCSAMGYNGLQWAITGYNGLSRMGIMVALGTGQVEYGGGGGGGNGVKWDNMGYGVQWAK
jgi:hypothetical protein